MFLHVVGHNQRFRVSNNSFKRSMKTISRYFKQVLYAIGGLRRSKKKREYDDDDDGLPPSLASMNFPLLSHMTINSYYNLLIVRMN